MNFLRAMRRVFKRRTEYECLAHEWITYERAWRDQYEVASHARRRELVDALREERKKFYARKAEIESIECEEPYVPLVFQPTQSERAPLKTAGQILAEKGYGSPK